jgi:hypothetical protein
MFRINERMKRLSKAFVVAGLTLAFTLPISVPAQLDSGLSDGQTVAFFGAGLGNKGRGALSYGMKRGTLGFQLGIFNNLDFGNERFSNINPPNDTIFLGNYKTEPGFGLDALFFLGQKDQSLYVGLGLYSQIYTRVWRSPSTDLLFDFGREARFEGAYSLGFMAITGPDSTFGFGYHTHLGWHLTFGNKR